VPEPTTMIAGALLLLPFGASTLRILRKSRAV
jgi:F0F1-type ATP synthase assembly protein I